MDGEMKTEIRSPNEARMTGRKNGECRMKMPSTNNLKPADRVTGIDDETRPSGRALFYCRLTEMNQQL
jgi:hypothetical protein